MASHVRLLDELKEVLSLPPLPEEYLGNYHTPGGFMFSQIGHIPKKTESFEWGDWRFEAMDMERNRVAGPVSWTASKKY